MKMTPVISGWFTDLIGWLACLLACHHHLYHVIYACITPHHPPITINVTRRRPITSSLPFQIEHHINYKLVSKFNWACRAKCLFYTAALCLVYVITPAFNRSWCAGKTRHMNTWYDEYGVDLFLLENGFNTGNFLRIWDYGQWFY